MNYEDIKSFRERAYSPAGHEHAKGAVTEMEFIIHLLLDEINELRQYVENRLNKEMK
jgi:hypothetical protein